MKNNIFYITLFNILLICAFSSEAQAGDFCKRGKYFHKASSSLCRSRTTNYCHSRAKGYHRCAATTATAAAATPEVAATGSGEYCKRGKYFHFANSRACSNRSINYCHSRSRGYYQCSAAQAAPAPSVATIPTPTPAATAATGEFCKRGKYFHRANSGMCSGYAVNYCHSRAKGYHRCSGAPATSTGSGSVAYQSLKCSSPAGKTPFQCMMCNCYHEARGEGPNGRLAVGKVVMTRARMRAYPNSVCGVVYDGQDKRYSQFSWTKSSNRHKTLARTGYNKCYPQVRAALNYNGHYASHYHTKSVRPKWRRNCTGRKTVGNHYFYTDCGSQSRARTGMNVST